MLQPNGNTLLQRTIAPSIIASSEFIAAPSRLNANFASHL